MPESLSTAVSGRASGNRVHAIVAAARQILDECGGEGWTMRRLGDAAGICAPSPCKHISDQAAVAVALTEEGLNELAALFGIAVAAHGPSLATMAKAYRGFVRDRPALYHQMKVRPLPRVWLRNSGL